MKPRILIIGESCQDIFIYGKTPRLCPEAPAPVFNPMSVIENGGMANNVLRNVHALGGEADLLTNENWKSITKTRFIDSNMNHMFIRVDENDLSYGTCDYSSVDFDKYDGVIVSDYNKGFLSCSDIEAICEKHENVFIDTKKTLGSWCYKSRFIKINKSEYEKTKHSIDEKIKDKLIITLSKEGCMHNGVVYPVVGVEIKDVAGAGDTFISALAVKYLHNSDISEAITFANECATTVVQKRGTSTI